MASALKEIKREEFLDYGDLKESREKSYRIIEI